MKKEIFSVTLGLLFCMFVGNTQAQKTLTGIVTDAGTKSPLEGASVEVVNSKAQTVTDAQGRFSLQVPAGKLTLKVTFVGFVEQTVSINADQNSVSIALASSATQLSDVVIVGVQSIVRRKSTSAISTVTSEEIENLPAPSVDQLLQGRVAGLNVQVGSATPGVAPTVVVRGNSKVSTKIGDDPLVSQAQAMSAPLYVIDGMPMNPEDLNSADNTGTNFLAGINVNDIASVDIQKDAAATAAWGSRGANGVIYITTKKGTSKVPELRINAYGGLVQVPKLLKTLVGAAEREQKWEIINKYATPKDLVSLPLSLTDIYNPAYNNATDWQGLFYGNGSIANIDATISASSSNVNYRIGLNYYDEKGIIKAFGFKRYGIRGNFNFKMSQKLDANLIVGISKGDRQKGIMYNNSDDNTPVSGTKQPASFYRLTGFDSLSFLGLYDKLRNKNISDYYAIGLNVNYAILPDLRYALQASANVTGSNRDYFEPSNIDAVAALDPDEVQPAYGYSSKSTLATYFINNSLNFSKTFANKKTMNIISFSQVLSSFRAM